MFSLAVTGVAISAGAYYLYKHCIASQPEIVIPIRTTTTDFLHIGVVKQIIIYPLDGGPGRYVTSAHCKKTGLLGDAMEDRAYVAYSGTTKTAILNLLKPQLVTRCIKKIMSKIFVSDGKIRPQPINIKYLGGTMAVEDEGDEIARIAAIALGNIGEDIRIGYCSPKYKQNFDDHRVSDPNSKNLEIVDDNSPYFSHYTLINLKSLKYLEQQTNERVYPSDFRANLVIDGPAFCEDKIFSLKIGNNIFYDIKPCTHSPSAFISQENIINPQNLPIYQFLKRNRPYNDPNLKFPIFGINMTLVSEAQGNIICVGDSVLASMFVREDN